MENHSETAVNQPVIEQQVEESQVLGTTSIILYGISLVLAGIGFYVMFHYGDYNSDIDYGDKSGHIVGGDAYNYIIIGIRGLGYLVAGLLSGVIASAFLIVDKMNKMR